jgi:mono/diheme cytochrome c family protein
MRTLSFAMLAASLALGATAQPPANTSSPVARGKYLVNAMSCHDCHTPKKMGPQGIEPDMSRMLSGQPEASVPPAPPRLPAGPWIALGNTDFTAWAGPWGVSYAINLTPDPNTGLGSWSEETFVMAMRTGRHMGASRPILPPMPWVALNSLTDEDLKAVFAYLRTIPPIKNRVPEAVIVPPPTK